MDWLRCSYRRGRLMKRGLSVRRTVLRAVRLRMSVGMMLVNIGRVPWIIFRIIHGRPCRFRRPRNGRLVFGRRLRRLRGEFSDGGQDGLCGEAGKLWLR